MENKSANSIVITGDNLIAIARIYDYLPEFFFREIFGDCGITEDNKVEMILAALLGNVSREKEK